MTDFNKGDVHDFNLTIDGKVYTIRAFFTGMGEDDLGYFQRVLSDGSHGYKFKWTKEQAMQMLPCLWEEERASF